MIRYEATCSRVRAEAHASRDKFGAYRSAHEGFGVLSEEVAELLDAIRANDAAQIANEAMQVSAVALRLSHEILCEPEMMDRSGVRK